MLKPGDGKIAALLIARKMKKKGKGESYEDEPEAEPMESGHDEGLVAAAEDIISAVKRGDPEALIEALKDAHMLACSSCSTSSEED